MFVCYLSTLLVVQTNLALAFPLQSESFAEKMLGKNARNKIFHLKISNEQAQEKFGACVSPFFYDSKQKF